MTFNAGDRVKYRAGKFHQQHMVGYTGTVVDHQSSNTVKVTWDNGYKKITGCYPENLELINSPNQWEIRWRAPSSGGTRISCRVETVEACSAVGAPSKIKRDRQTEKITMIRHVGVQSSFPSGESLTDWEVTIAKREKLESVLTEVVRADDVEDAVAEWYSADNLRRPKDIISVSIISVSKVFS